MTSPPSSSLRVSVTVTPEVHSAFKRLADASGMSMSRAMGEWLTDTLDAAEFMAEKIEQARAAPKLVMREMQAYALGLADEVGVVLENARKQGSEARKAAAGTRKGDELPPGVPIPPSSNTGGKGPRRTNRKPGG